MDDAVLRRVVAASVAPAVIVGGVAVFLGWYLFDPVLALPAVGGAVVLGLAQLFRAAATLRRSRGLSGLGIRVVVTTCISVALTSLAVSLLAAGLGNDGECHVLGCLVGARAWLLFAEGRALEWAPCPREATHRRVKSKIFSTAFLALYSALACVVVAALADGSPVLSGIASARLAAGVLTLLAGELHAEALQSCTALAPRSLPSRGDLVAGLSQPLGVSGPNMGRWAALTALAQAVAHRQCGTFPGVRAGTGMAIGADTSSASYAMPPLATEVFGRGSASGPTPMAAPAAAAPGAAAPGTAGLLFGSPQLQVPFGNSGNRSSLFSVYLMSGLEVVREFTVRVQCLVGASRRRDASALLPAQLASLDAQAVELVPLVKVSVTGLAGWICLSRDLDEAGVVQRELALQRVLIDLCGVHCALRELVPLRGVLDISAGCILSAEEEVRHSLEELLLAFRDAGLQQVHLPSAYKHLIMEICR